MQSLSRGEAKIIAELQSDARQTNRAIAQSVGLAASTALDRTRDLERRGVVTGYHADVNLKALGRELQAFVSVRINP
ncbi:MAG: Lrp/AsnC family transcriptional regulator, partial [Acidimicrobiales bacterium]